MFYSITNGTSKNMHTLISVPPCPCGRPHRVAPYYIKTTLKRSPGIEPAPSDKPIGGTRKSEIPTESTVLSRCYGQAHVPTPTMIWSLCCSEICRIP
ncbi:hypothetical protein [uncultured Gimesia sp.]|uniref:hypothetical protein n=1 Tax=uncultured Gimesia sp. TaxID=1678688 RepID=UPI0030DD632B